jgi:hypothetical protein
VRSVNNWLDASGVNTVLAADGSGEVVVRTAGAQRWKVDNAGKFLAVTDNAYDIGSSSVGRPRDLYVGRDLYAAASLEGSGKVRAKGWSTAGSGHAAEIGVSAGEGVLISYDRTAPAAYKPLVLSGSETYLGYSGNKAWKVGSGGHLQAVTDNVHDIGSSSANRPRTGYFGSGVVVGSDGIKWKATDSNVNVMYASGSEDIQILRHFGTKPNTLLQIWAPTGSGEREATLALVRGDNNEEFLDLYNNDYEDETQYGIRIQKRSTGQWQDFVFDRAYKDGMGMIQKEPMFILRATNQTANQVSAEFYGQWVRLPKVTNPTGALEGAIWFDTADHKIKCNNGTTTKIVAFEA